MNRNETIAAFIQDVKQILAEDTERSVDLERIAERMRQLIAEPVIREWQEPGGNVHKGQQSVPLYQEENGLTLMNASFTPDAMTPIHNHNSWGIVGLYRGRDRYQVWRRVDAGSTAGDAHVELIEERILEPGDVITFPPPPQDIHAQQGYAGETAYELVLFGNNPMGKPRLYFEPDQNIAHLHQR
jgi:predicted metal-dependent enzyme (double-stranded beta helix superfamily)